MPGTGMLDRHDTGARHVMTHRVLPAVAVGLIIAGGLYGGFLLALTLIRVIIMPIVSVAVGGYLGYHVYRHLGREERTPPEI